VAELQRLEVLLLLGHFCSSSLCGENNWLA
jgi:hypothetical protein